MPALNSMTSKSKTGQKPYRRGETMGKASRRGRLPTVSSSATMAVTKPTKARTTTLSKGKEPREFPSRNSMRIEEKELEHEIKENSEEEWGGIQSSSSSLDGEADERGKHFTHELGPPHAIRRKKGKKFVESQDALLQLVSSIAGEKELKKKEKIQKYAKVKKSIEKEHQLKEKKDQNRQSKLDAARAVVAIHNRTKQDRKALRDNSHSAQEGTSFNLGRKTVSFA